MTAQLARVLLLAAAFSMSTQPWAFAQGAMTNGSNYPGAIDTAGEIDVWTLAAGLNQTVIVSIGEPSGDTSGFSPSIRVLAPGGAQLAANTGLASATVSFQAPVAGTYSVQVAAGAPNTSGTGSYRLTFAAVPGPSTVDLGDQGGAMTDGRNHVGRIESGELDVWTFDASTGSSVIINLGEPNIDTSNFQPRLRVYDQVGTVVADANGLASTWVQLSNAMQGRYTVVVADLRPGFGGVGDYRVSFVTIPGTHTVDAGDQGGPVIVDRAHPGHIDTADVDTWTVTASEGNVVGVSVQEVGGDSSLFSPWIRVFDRDGLIVVDERDSYLVTHTFTAATTGTYTIVVAAGAPAYDGLGDYALVVTGASTPVDVQPPTGLYAYAVVGNLVTVRWTPPTSGPAPTGYVMEGGVAAGAPLVAIPTGTAVPLFIFAAPNGSFYIRMRSTVGGTQSAPSTEIRVHVNVAVPPSAPTGVTGMVNNSQLSLGWQTTFAGGAPANLVLDVSGTLNASLPIGLTDTFSFNPVPAGTYTFSLRAQNGAGVSGPSNTVTLTFPQPCTGAPQVPQNFLAFATGNVLTLLWDPATSGDATTGYILTVGGAFNAALPLANRGIAAPVPPGTYTFTITAANACGASAPTAVRTVVVP